MKVLVVDRDESVCALVQEILEDYCDEQNEAWDIFCQADMKELERTVMDEFYDLIFCGFEDPDKDLRQKMWRQLRLQGAEIIYVVPQRYPILSLMQSHPFACIEKPLDRAAIYEAIHDYDVIRKEDRQSISFKKQNHVDLYRISEIFYIESIGRQIRVVAENQEGTYYSPISSLEFELRGRHFLRCHNSYLANYDKVVEVTHDCLMFPGGRIVPISQGKRKEVMAQIQKWEKGI